MPWAAANASGSSAFTVEEVAPGVYLHRGAHARLEDPARADSANISFVVGARCVAVIDSGGAVATGQALAAAIAAKTPKPVCYVINTHVHFDHVLGNAAWQDSDTRFVGHSNLAEAMAANREFFSESFAAELGGPGQGTRVIGPDVLVEGKTELDLGDRVLELAAEPVAHTTTDLTVHDPASGTLWTGDLLFRERMPVLDGSLKGWLAWHKRAMAVPYTAVIPGHGPVDRAWPAGAEPQFDYLQQLLRETRQAIAEGKFLDEAQASVATDAQGRWQLAERAHRVNVSRAFRELEWE